MLSFFPRGVLDEFLNLIESVSEGFSFLFLFVIVVSGEPKQKQGPGLVTHKLVQAPSNFIAGRPKAARLF